MVKVLQHPRGPRVYVLGLRLHHGTSGAVLAAALWKAHHRSTAVAFAMWAATDWRDFPFTDSCNH